MAVALRRSPMVPGSRAHAVAVQDAQARLNHALGPLLSLDGPFSILLFLFIEAGRAGVSTAACCGATPAPRTTAQRWITSLVRQGLVVQESDDADGRVTLLRLTDPAERMIRQWLLALAGASPEASPRRDG